MALHVRIVDVLSFLLLLFYSVYDLHQLNFG